VTAHNNVVRPIWARLFGNDLSVWTALVDTEVLANTTEENQNPFFSMEAAYPIPFLESAANFIQIASQVDGQPSGL